jgi:hypothetical protein
MSPVTIDRLEKVFGGLAFWVSLALGLWAVLELWKFVFGAPEGNPIARRQMGGLAVRGLVAYVVTAISFIAGGWWIILGGLFLVGYVVTTLLWILTAD